MQAWVLWNEERGQYQGDCDAPKLYATRDKALGAVQFDPESTLNVWRPVLVRIIPAVKRGKAKARS